MRPPRHVPQIAPIRGLVVCLTFALLLLSQTIFTGPAKAGDAIRLEALPGQKLLLAGQTQRFYLRINLEGLPLPRSHSRAPVNVAIVIDRSGSMRGEKLARAKQAAIMAINLMGSDDIVSVVSYSDRVKVVVPATRLASKAEIVDQIEQLDASGMTALYAGVRAGADELRRFLEQEQVNRVVLLSDGLANVGPRTPEELGALGRALVQEGISVTTIGLGLGYNEDLMAKLAYNSDGNHAFVEKASELVKVFEQEFGDVLSVVAQDVDIIITCHGRVRPLRVLGRTAQISGQRIRLRLNQIYGAQEKYVVVELEVPKDMARGKARIADVEVDYLSLLSRQRGRLAQSVEIGFTANPAEAQSSLDRKVMTGVINQIAIEKNEMAVRLRDKGKTKKAIAVLKENAAFLRQQAKKLAAPKLEALAQDNLRDATALARPRDWNKTRKSMRYKQFRGKVQQKY